LEWLVNKKGTGPDAKPSGPYLQYQIKETIMKKNAHFIQISIFILAMIMLVLPSMQASAILVRCRTDPIFKLSNGDTVTVTLDISTADTNVRNVTYIVHVPARVTVSKVTYTAGGIGTKEMYKVYQDSPAKTYTTDTVVTTQNTGSVAVIVTTKLNSTYVKSASGYNGQHLIVTISKP
jgi:hypothetical protein